MWTSSAVTSINTNPNHNPLLESTLASHLYASMWDVVQIHTRDGILEATALQLTMFLALSFKSLSSLESNSLALDSRPWLCLWA